MADNFCRDEGKVMPYKAWMAKYDSINDDSFRTNLAYISRLIYYKNMQGQMQYIKIKNLKTETGQLDNPTQKESVYNFRTI